MKIAYSQCWEDASIVLNALQINDKDIVLSISSGGCNTIAIAEEKPSLIFAIDSNQSQNYLLELKLAAIQNLNKKNTLALLGYRNCSNRYEIFSSLIPVLSKQCRDFWMENKDFIEKGVVHCGKFEKYIQLFRKCVLPIVFKKDTIRKLVIPKNKTEQEKFYIEKWDSFRWRLIFKIFFSRAVMSGRGRNKQMFAHSKNISIASIYYNRVKKALMKGVIYNNFYLNYILFKDFEELPLYLECSDKGCNSIESIKISNHDILSFLKSMPENSISKFNLSDIFEPLTQDVMNEIINEIYRVAKPNARLIFWNNLVHRDINKDKLSFFERDTKLEDELIKQDKIFLYECFYIYRIKK